MNGKGLNAIAKTTTNDAKKSAEITLSEKGVPVISAANFKVQQIALDYLKFGNDVDEIQKQHPFLTKIQIEAAISYYLAHKEWFDAKIEESLREYEKLHRDSADSPISKKIRAWRELR